MVQHLQIRNALYKIYTFFCTFVHIYILTKLMPFFGIFILIYVFSKFLTLEKNYEMVGRSFHQTTTCEFSHVFVENSVRLTDVTIDSPSVGSLGSYRWVWNQTQFNHSLYLLVDSTARINILPFSFRTFLNAEIKNKSRLLNSLVLCLSKSGETNFHKHKSFPWLFY